MLSLLLVQAIAVSGLLGGLVPVSLAWAEESDSTVGTASTVSPSTVAPGGTLRYTLSGFPAGTQVEILLDDVETQVLANVAAGGDGTASGMVELPKLIGMGPHWLRFRTKRVAAATASATASGTVRAPGAAESPAANATQATLAPSPAVSNKSPFFSVGEVTVIGATPAQRPAAVTNGRADAEPKDADRDTDDKGGVSALSGAVLATAAVVCGLAVGIVINRRRRLALGFGSSKLQEG